MSRPKRALVHGAGIALIVAILWTVGWNDRVTGTDGSEHVGRVTHVGEREARMDDGTTIPIEDARAVRHGLGGALATLTRNPLVYVAALSVHLLGIVATFLRWAVLLAGAGLATPIQQVVRLGWIANFFASLVPGGIASGDVIKSVYITRTHAGRKTRSVVTVIMDRVMGLGILCAIAATAVFVAPEIDRTARTIILSLLALTLFGTLLLFSPTVRKRLPKTGIIGEIEKALAAYSGRPGSLAAAAGISIVSHALMLSGFYLYAKAMGTELSLLAVGAAIPVAQMLAAVPGLPGGWGVGDFAFFFFLPTVGVPAGQAVALSFVYRLSHTLLSLPGGLMLARRKE